MTREPGYAAEPAQLSSNLLEFLLWVAARSRGYTETMEAWRTSCPRLPVWEDAVDAGFIEQVGVGRQTRVQLTRAGRAALADRR